MTLTTPRLSQERFAARARAARQAPLRRALAALLALVVLIGLGWAVLGSSLLSVDTVAVEGVAGADAKAVTDRVGAVRGTPLARVDTDGIAARVGELAPVRSVEVLRSWPSTLTVKVSPRVPALALAVAAGGFEIADADGVRFRTVAKVPAGLPVVAADGDRPLTPEALQAALGVVTALPPALARRTSAVTVSSADLVRLTVGSVSVVWGGPESAERKARLVEVLLKAQPKAKVIDVSAPDTPVTR